MNLRLRCFVRKRNSGIPNTPGTETASETAAERGRSNARQGRWGEQAAERYLVAKKWKVVARNARPCSKDRRYEIDLICQTPVGGLVFVEVKTHARHSERASRLFGIDKRKRKVLLRACSNWILKYRWHGSFRFDVVEVYGSYMCDAPPKIDHIENVRLFPPTWRFW